MQNLFNTISFLLYNRYFIKIQRIPIFQILISQNLLKPIILSFRNIKRILHRIILTNSAFYLQIVRIFIMKNLILSIPIVSFLNNKPFSDFFFLIIHSKQKLTLINRISCFFLAQILNFPSMVSIAHFLFRKSQIKSQIRTQISILIRNRRNSFQFGLKITLRIKSFHSRI